jgi:hypothetical protein
VPPQALEAARRVQDAMSTSLFANAKNQFYPAILAETKGPLAFVLRLAALKVREIRIAKRFANAPKIDYVDSKAKIESLNTQAFAGTHR